MGKTVRKEDEYDIDEEELERNVDQCIKTYVISSVYYDKYDGSSDTSLKCIQEWDRCICGNPHWYDRRFGKYVEPIKVIPSYVKKNWETGKSYKSLVDKKMSEEEKKVKRMEKAEDNSIKNLEEEKKAMVDSYQAQIDALQKQLKALDDNSADEEEKLRRLKKELSDWQKDDSVNIEINAPYIE